MSEVAVTDDIRTEVTEVQASEMEKKSLQKLARNGNLQ